VAEPRIVPHPQPEFQQLFSERTVHNFIANQIAATISATTITAHTTGVTRFELPLRGESFAA
jgi:hypothetical protein